MTDKKFDFNMEPEEIMEAYADYLTDAWAAEYDEILDQVKQKEQRKQSGKRKRTPRFSKALSRAAILIGVICAVGFMLPTTEVSAWRIWNLDFLFEQQDDHVDISIQSRETFPQYYVDEVPEGYTVSEEEISRTWYYVKYEDEEGHFILFMQVKKEHYNNHSDSENAEGYNDIIGDFKFYILDSEDYTILEAATDTEVIVVNSNAAYEEVESFIHLLREY